LETVQFLRVVPLNAEGAEAPFDKCGIVPVAVPNSRLPPTPRLEGKVDSDSGFARLEIFADSFDRALLERDEPGIFNPSSQGNQPPEFRIRRAVGKVKDVVYAHPIATGPLALQAPATSDTVFSATFTDDSSGRGLEAFVPYVYWAEVRLPPERRLPANVIPESPGDVTTIYPANAEDQPRPWSLPSAPRVLMYIPKMAPAAPLPLLINVTRIPADDPRIVKVNIQIDGAPHAHNKAIDHYRLAVWSQWPDQEIVPFKTDTTSLDEGNGVVAVSVPLPTTVLETSTLTLRLAIVDPVLRQSDITIFKV